MSATLLYLQNLSLVSSFCAFHFGYNFVVRCEFYFIIIIIRYKWATISAFCKPITLSEPNAYFHFAMHTRFGLFHNRLYCIKFDVMWERWMWGWRRDKRGYSVTCIHLDWGEDMRICRCCYAMSVCAHVVLLCQSVATNGLWVAKI